MSRFKQIAVHLLVQGVFLTVTAAQRASMYNFTKYIIPIKHDAALPACADVTIPPRSVNISLNGVAEFNCTGVASGFVWESNGMEVINDGIRTLISHAISVDAANGIRMSTLRMKVSSTDNATNITCTALKSSPLSSNRSAPALLLVQGNYYTIAI